MESVFISGETHFEKRQFKPAGRKKPKQNKIRNLKWSLVDFHKNVFFIKSAQHLSSLEAVKEHQLRSVVYSECGITRVRRYTSASDKVSGRLLRS